MTDALQPLIDGNDRGVAGAIVAFLKADTALNTHLGGRIRVGRFPHGTQLPFCSCRLLSSSENFLSDGTLLDEQRIEVALSSVNENNARWLSNYIRDTLASKKYLQAENCLFHLLPSGGEMNEEPSRSPHGGNVYTARERFTTVIGKYLAPRD